MFRINLPKSSGVLIIEMLPFYFVYNGKFGKQLFAKYLL